MTGWVLVVRIEPFPSRVASPSSPRRFGGMPDKELLAYSVVVVVSVVALGLLMTMTGRRVQGMHGKLSLISTKVSVDRHQCTTREG